MELDIKGRAVRLSDGVNSKQRLSSNECRRRLELRGDGRGGFTRLITQKHDTKNF